MGPHQNWRQGADAARVLVGLLLPWRRDGVQVDRVLLVGRERWTKGWMATTIPSKGGMGRFAVDKRLEFVGECGDIERDIIVKSDQETRHSI